MTRKPIKKSNCILFFLIAGLFLILGTTNLIKSAINISYTSPVYISKEINISASGTNIYIRGQLRNRDDKEQKVKFTLRAYAGHKEYADKNFNIIIPAKSYYDLDGTYYIPYSDSSKFTKASISNFYIDNERIDIKYLPNDETYTIDTNLILATFGCSLIFFIFGFVVLKKAI